MPQTTCSSCGASVGDEEFCPACGQWVGEDEAGFEEFSLPEPPDNLDDLPPVDDVGYIDTITCPSCGSANPSHNRHCEECGARLVQGPLPVAPQPMVQMSAGARALLVIVAVIVLVGFIALIRNVFSGDDEATPAAGGTTETTSTPDVEGPPEQIADFLFTCSSELPVRPCTALFDGTEAAWNDASNRGIDAEIEVTFTEPVALERVVITNYEDEENFRRNYRVRGYQISTDERATPWVIDFLPDEPGVHVIPIQTLNTRRLLFTVESTYESEAFNGDPFPELAIQELQFFGRPIGTSTADGTQDTVTDDTVTETTGTTEGG